MKIKPKDFEQLERGIKKAIDALPPDWIKTLRTVCSHASELQVLEQIRWSIFWFAQHEGFLMVGDGIGVPGIPLYGYLNDDHIDTALRRIIGKQFDKP